MTTAPSRAEGRGTPRLLDSAGVRWELAPGLDRAGWNARLERAVALAEDGHVANEKTGRRKELYRLHLETEDPHAPPDYLLKVNRYPWRDGWRRRWAGSKARRELDRATRVAALGIPTPIPCAAGERVERGRISACYLLVPVVAGARDLRQAWTAGLARQERGRLAARFGAFVRAIHDAGIDQDDLAPNNFLVDPDGRLLMIDFERASVGASVTRAARHRALAKLDRELAGAGLADRARFLIAYAGKDTDAWKPLWRVLECEAGALAARDARRLVRVTSQPGRRFRRVRSGEWEGSRRAEVDPAVLGTALRALLQAPPTDAGTGLAYRVTADWWALEQPLSGQKARAALAVAELLSRRGGLGPRPVAQLSRRTRTLTLFAGALPPRASEAEDARALLPSLTILLDRLLALGRLDALDTREIAVGVSCARTATALLAACRLHADGQPEPARHERARAEARRLLGLGA